MASVPHYHVTGALIRQEEELLLVQQKDGPEADAFWDIPGGRVRRSEFLVEGLVREIIEETGLQILDVGELAYVARVNNPQIGYQSTTRVFEVNAWRGTLDLQDASQHGIITVEFVPTTEVATRLQQIPYPSIRDPLLAYLQGEALPGSIWLYEQAGYEPAKLITRLNRSTNQAS